MTDGQAPSKRSGRRKPGPPASQHAARVAGVRTPKPHTYRFAEDAPLIPNEAAAAAHGWRPNDHARAAVVARADVPYDTDNPFATAQPKWPLRSLTDAVNALAAPHPHRFQNVAPLRPAATRDLAFIAPAIVTTPPNAAYPAPAALPPQGQGLAAARTSRPGWDGSTVRTGKKAQFRTRTADLAGLPDPHGND